MKWYISLCKKSVVRVHLCYGYRAGFLEAELCVKVAKSVESNCSSSQFLQALTSETVRAGNLAGSVFHSRAAARKSYITKDNTSVRMEW